MPSIKYNLKLVPAACNIIPPGFRHLLYIIFGCFMQRWCEFLLKLAQNSFHCAPDECARSAVGAATSVARFPHPAEWSWKFCAFPCSPRWEITYKLGAACQWQGTGREEEDGWRAPCLLLWQHQTELPVSGQSARAAQQGRAQARGEFCRIPGSGCQPFPTLCCCRFSATPAWSAHCMELCVPPPPAQGFCFFGGGGGCFSVPADVNKIARWYFNALQRDRNLLLPMSRGSHSFAFPEVV